MLPLLIYQGSSLLEKLGILHVFIILVFMFSSKSFLYPAFSPGLTATYVHDGYHFNWGLIESQESLISLFRKVTQLQEDDLLIGNPKSFTEQFHVVQGL